MTMNPNAVDGLFLFASYPSKSMDMSDLDIPMISIYGELDGLTEVKDVENNKKYMPKDTTYHQIVGGNHSWFGSYGLQRKDTTEGTIVSETQQREIADVMHQWLDQKVK